MQKKRERVRCVTPDNKVALVSVRLYHGQWQMSGNIRPLNTMIDQSE